MHQLITPAINTIMAKNTIINVCLDDFLSMIWQIPTASRRFNHSTERAQINAASKLGRREYGRNNDSLTASSKYLCHYCGEVRHWFPNFPVRSKANEAGSGSQRQNANVASVGIFPMLESDAALLDYGAMHSVVGNISLFTSLVKTDMKLAVASSKLFDVEPIGTIKLNTPNGILQLDGVVY
ncbi:hypothetical protein O181_081909 [Austropuccinia psidii MF-1]|uniref:Uncharacterized protein n=1 Tax=Austropuccinia psidii MF-1 TaxID=1389203 RepID=A0A9Q3FNP9_9BASI|nr:hypothetical protein [Austropuccinia psidii MF-1]